MANRKKRHPDRRNNRQHIVNSKIESCHTKSESEQTVQAVNHNKRRVDWKKLANQFGIPALILSLFASFVFWTVQSIYDIKKELACVSTELACYEDFVNTTCSIGLEWPMQSDSAEASS